MLCSWVRPKFPAFEPIRPFGQVAKNIEIIRARKARKEQQASGENKPGPHRNRGEVSTVLVAKDRGIAVLIDEKLGAQPRRGAQDDAPRLRRPGGRDGCRRCADAGAVAGGGPRTTRHQARRLWKLVEVAAPSSGTPVPAGL